MSNENSLQIFNNSEFGKVRSLTIDGKPFFVANDVARMLGYKKPRRAVELHCDDATDWGVLDSNGRKQEENLRMKLRSFRSMFRRNGRVMVSGIMF